MADCFVNTARLPAWGHEHEARSIRTTPGGKALNQAVALARLGAQVAAVGAVGDDGVGRDVLSTLRREGVDISWMDVREGATTSICLCFVSDHGDSAIVWHIDDEMAVRPETVRRAASAIERADAVLVTFEIPVSAIREAISTGQRGGARVVVAPAPLLADSADAASLPWEQVDVLVPNENEARALLSGGEDVRAGQLAGALSRELGVPTVAVTLGAAGCSVHTAGESHHYPAHRVDAVDTTGAGDASRPPSRRTSRRAQRYPLPSRRPRPRRRGQYSARAATPPCLRQLPSEYRVLLYNAGVNRFITSACAH